VNTNAQDIERSLSYEEEDLLKDREATLHAEEEEEDVANGISEDFLRMKEDFVNDPLLTDEQIKLLPQ
jgi:hypothetical protein